MPLKNRLQDLIKTVNYRKLNLRRMLATCEIVKRLGCSTAVATLLVCLSLMYFLLPRRHYALVNARAN